VVDWSTNFELVFWLVEIPCLVNQLINRRHKDFLLNKATDNNLTRITMVHTPCILAVKSCDKYVHMHYNSVNNLHCLMTLLQMNI